MRPVLRNIKNGIPPEEGRGLKVRSPKALISELLWTLISVSFILLPLLCLGLPQATHLSSVDLLGIQHSPHVHGCNSFRKGHENVVTPWSMQYLRYMLLNVGNLSKIIILAILILATNLGFRQMIFITTADAFFTICFIENHTFRTWPLFSRFL